MGSIADMYNRVKAIDQKTISAIAASSINATANELVILNRDQMYDGKRRDQHDITPSYFEDPFFKTPERAKAYSDWKDKITPNPNRKKGVPNLFIVGTFHGTISAKANQKEVIFESEFPEAQDIENKFSKFIYGIGGPYKAEYIRNYLSGVFQKSMRDAARL